MLDQIKTTRKSDWVINVALILNALLTFMFAYNYLPNVFDVFGLLDASDGNDLFVRILAGVFAVIVFDGAYHAWGAIRNRLGLTTEQIATADTAKTASLFGSLAASLGQFVMGQTAVELHPNIVFGVSVVATLAVAFIALLHMYWWDKFKNESFEAVERSFQAETEAENLTYQQRRTKEMVDLAKKQDEDEHTLAVQQKRAEMELEMEKIKAEFELERELIMQEIDHERQVAEQTRQLLQESVHKDAAHIAKIKSERLRQRFISRQGLNVEDVERLTNGVNGHNGSTHPFDS